MLTKIIVIIVSSTILVSCSFYHHDKHHPLDKPALVPQLIPELAKIKAVHAVALDFDKNTPKVINVATGREVTPCGKFENKQVENNVIQDTSKNLLHQEYNTTSSCDAKLVNPSAALRNAINSTKQSFKGTLMKNGKLTKFTGHVIVIMNYEGSYCNTTFAAGTQRDSCYSLQDLCNYYFQQYPELTHENTPIYLPMCAPFI